MIDIRRRGFAALAVSGIAAPMLARGAAAQPGAKDTVAVKAAIDRFAKLPVTSASCRVSVSSGWSLGHDEKKPLFIGSAIKTFILAQVLRGVEAGRLKEETLVTIDDKVRSPSSPVFIELGGKTMARNALEAMIAHSDNTATDVAMAAAGVADVRALIAEARLDSVRVPTSTRRLFIYLATGKSQDLSWSELLKLLDHPTNPQPAVNTTESMMGSAADMVSWYQMALAGKFFTKPATLVEFKRIQAMADSLVHVVPPDTVAYGKGGSIDWNNFHCFSLPGQMIIKGVPVTFCFTINWTGGTDADVKTVFGSYVAAVADVLGETAKAIG
jgi:beta-lactamase class A